MQARSIRLTIAVLFAVPAWGQVAAGQSVSQVFQFSYWQQPIYMQQLVNAIRTVGEITQSSVNFDAKTLTVSGTPAQIATAAWMFATLDQPAPSNHATQEFRPAGSVDDVLRVLYITHPQTAQSMQEIVNSLRTVADVSKLFPLGLENAIAFRGTESQAAMTEWLFHQLDLPPGVQPPANPAAHQYMAAAAPNDEVQVLFLAHSWTPVSMQQIANTMRVIPQLPKVFSCGATGAVSVRGPSHIVALAAWVFSQLDQAPASSVSPQTFHMPGGADDVTQVFYLKPSTGPERSKSIVTAVRTTGSLLIFPDDIFDAVTLRGTATQIAAADLVIQQMIAQ